MVTLKDFEACVEEANKRSKKTLGHTFANPLRPQCVHCGRSDRAETKCPKEQRTFVMRLTEILMEHGAISPVMPGSELILQSPISETSRD